MSLSERFKQVRALSEQYCAPLEIEDFGLQAMPETSPAKWHLAHTTWFFETFILKPFVENYSPVNSQYKVLFNSYYNGIGAQRRRDQRGLLSRPTVAEVMNYRRQITECILHLLRQAHPEIESLVELGINHEQQHQELFFTDLKYNFSCNPLKPAYCEDDCPLSDTPPERGNWLQFAGKEIQIGHTGEGFSFDNETPRHAALLADFELRDTLVSNREYLEFVEDGGYHKPELWLADGWAMAQAQKWQAPLYWDLGQQREFTLYGMQPLDMNGPVSHVSVYEADAFARWAGCRLPSEQEWEHAANQQSIQGQFLESGWLHPTALSPNQLHGTLWQWTSSAYAPYPGFQAATGAIGEYNGKFMVNQLVLRGGSCVSSHNHIRTSYRNFFYPPDRWQFTGIRMAK